MAFETGIDGLTCRIEAGGPEVIGGELQSRCGFSAACDRVRRRLDDVVGWGGASGVRACSSDGSTRTTCPMNVTRFCTVCSMPIGCANTPDERERGRNGGEREEEWRQERQRAEAEREEDQRNLQRDESSPTVRS